MPFAFLFMTTRSLQLFSNVVLFLKMTLTIDYDYDYYSRWLWDNHSYYDKDYDYHYVTIRLFRVQGGGDGQLVPVEKASESSQTGKRTKAEVKVCHFCERKSKDSDWARAIRSWVPSVSLYQVYGIYVNLCTTS